ncbi:hypothetical protein [Mycolicibacterium sphagni]|uniref:Uncharacterized protein n=1 Tax=Mycolicibacterium sphagni TaxID=1786 RepID=A0ABX2K2G7_9MYCO|nr:hypothetical protein [Mycolicibacterium sphagni]NTY63387.1 hypothetical protein [Mycolicibacterium sphagni]
MAIVIIGAPGAAGMSAMKVALGGIAAATLVVVLVAIVSGVPLEHELSVHTARIAPAVRTSVRIALRLIGFTSIYVVRPSWRRHEVVLLLSLVGVNTAAGRYGLQCALRFRQFGVPPRG